MNSFNFPGVIFAEISRAALPRRHHPACTGAKLSPRYSVLALVLLLWIPSLRSAQVIATGLTGAGNLRPEAGTLYFSEASEIKKMPAIGGPITTLGGSGSFDIFGDNLVGGYGNYQAAFVFRQSKFGGPRTNIAGAFSGGSYVAVNAGFAYYLEGFGQFFKVPIAGGVPEIVAGPGFIRNSAFDENNLYFYEYNSKNVKWVGFAGGGGDLITGNSTEGSVFIDASHVYASQGGKIKRVSKLGGPVTTIADEIGLEGLASDGFNVFYTLAGKLKRIPVTGGSGIIMEDLAGGQVSSFAMDNEAYYWVDASGGDGAERIKRLPKVTSLKTWHRFDNGLNDESGSGNHGTARGNVQFGVGIVGTGLLLDGTQGTFVDAVPDVFIPHVTAAAWVRPGNTSDASLVDAWKNVENYRLAIRSGKFIAGFHKNGTSEIEVISQTAVQAGTIYHVAMTFDGVNLHLYVNGLRDQSNAQPAGIDSSPGVNPDLRLGIDRDGNQRFSGMLDEIRIYDTALSADEIAALTGNVLGRASISGSVSGLTGTGNVIVRAKFGTSSFSAVANPIGQFTVSSIPTGISYTMDAFQDENGNQSADINEWFGSRTTSPVFLDADKTGIDIQLLPPDGDGDGIYDPWELANGLNVGANDAGLDKDSDGISNVQEFWLGLAANDADSDDDGVSDGNELMLYGTDPMNSDSDDDQMSDAWEVENGLNSIANDASEDRDLDGLTNKEEFDLRAVGYRANAVNSKAGLSGDDGLSDYRRLKGEGWVKRSFDRSDRLIATEWDSGVLQAYVYDGNSQKKRDLLTISLDGDSDGLPDAWELGHALLFTGTGAGTGDNGASGDPDSDGFTNAQEWKAGSDPRAANQTINGGSTTRVLASITAQAASPGEWSLAAGQLDGSGPDEVLVGSESGFGQSNALMQISRQSGSWTTTSYSLGGAGVTSIILESLTSSGEQVLLMGTRPETGGGTVKQYAFVGSSLIPGTTIFSSASGSAYALDTINGQAVLFGSPAGGTANTVYKSAWNQTTWTSAVLAGTATAGLPSAAGFPNGIARWLDTTKIEYSALNPLPVGAVNRVGTNKWFFMSPSEVIWDQAENYARQWGGHLITIPDAATNAWVFPNFGAGPFWIGLTGYRSSLTFSRVYSWASGAAFESNFPRREVGDANLVLDYRFGFTYGPGEWDATSYNNALSGRFFRGLCEVDRVIAPVEAPIGEAGALIDHDTSLSWRRLRPTAADAESLMAAYISDRNGNAAVDAGDVFVVKELSPTPTQPTLRSTTQVPITASGALSYAFAVLGNSSAAPRMYVGEPDGTVSLWTAPDVTSTLVRKVFATEFAGKAWHQMEPLREADGREGLVGLLVDPAAPQQCQVIHWSPEALEAALSGTAPVLNHAPLARVLPVPSSGGGSSTVGVRIWDAEAHASRVAMQVQRAGETAWNAATVLSTNGGAAGTAALPALPGGVSHTLEWNAAADLGAAFNGTVLLRVQATDSQNLAGAWSEAMPFAVNAGAGLDSDGDGATDATEAAFGTNPNAPGSRPAVLVTVNANDTLTFTWPTAVGRTYRLETSTTLGAWTPVQAGLTAGTWTTPQPPESGLNSGRFYRVAAE